MKRTVIKIDDKICNGCGNCVEGCHEGALQLIDGKAVMISELYCDGLGACIGECPVGAIELIEKETEPYNEIAVMERISPKGEKVVLAHLMHLKNHGEIEWYKQGIEWCSKNNFKINIPESVEKRVTPEAKQEKMACGCPSSMERDFRADKKISGMESSELVSGSSELRQWPVQLHLLNPMAGYFQKADVLLASDCSAFTHGSFHATFLKNKILAIACPKLDSNTQSYVDKLTSMIDNSLINTLTVLIMEVPCCGGLLQLAKAAREKASRNIPLKVMVMSVKGEILSEEWV
ncbi:MAG: hypothetical protein ACD_77C00312G0003 [uncultured bacterium]|nr:MAG: hypothetical protein ACD_77C00312G0003 [uncultured bacterium]HBY01854.1 4Fe-4S ferredoxin [Rikenellaceae bacterium]